VNNLLETIFRSDSSGRYLETIRYLHTNRESPNVAHEIYQLLLQSRYLEAYVLAQLFRNLGATSPIILFAQALGGFLFNNGHDETQGTAALSALVDVLSAEQKEVIGRGIVHPVMSQVIMADASIVHDHRRALRILEIYKAGMPLLRSLFDWQATVPDLTTEELQRQGRARARLIPFAGPPAGAPRKPLRAIVAMRKLVFPGKADSRLFEMGLRMEHAMNSYGWRATYFAMNFDHQPDFAAITALCEQENADILFLDDYPVLAPATHGIRAAFIETLRQKRPGIKIVAMHLDPWAIDHAVLVKTAEQLDAVWAHFPANPAWSDPALVKKIVLVPFPHAGNFGEPVTPLSAQITFSGGVFGYNWHRAMWLAGVLHGLPLVLQMSTHTADGIPILESYGDYVRRIEASACALNFSMRPDLSRIITGRSFETLLAGALLVQEEAPDMDSYFVAGEHYLSFSNVAELRAIARFIAERPAEAEAIRRAGNVFARERYNDEKLIGYLDKDLFYRD
jgi:hypothetical protein